MKYRLKIPWPKRFQQFKKRHILIRHELFNRTFDIKTPLLRLRSLLPTFPGNSSKCGLKPRHILLTYRQTRGHFVSAESVDPFRTPAYHGENIHTFNRSRGSYIDL